MSRKMIDYQVENGKIYTIDGYKVGGDDIEPTKFSVITISSNSNTKIKEGNYTEGDTIHYAISKQMYTNVYGEQKELMKKSKPILLTVNTEPAYTVYKVGTAMFSIEPITNDIELNPGATDDDIFANVSFSAICIKAGTVTASDTFQLRTRIRVLLHNAQYIN